MYLEVVQVASDICKECNCRQT